MMLPSSSTVPAPGDYHSNVSSLYYHTDVSTSDSDISKIPGNSVFNEELRRKRQIKIECKKLGIQPPFPVKLFSNNQSPRQKRARGCCEFKGSTAESGEGKPGDHDRGISA